MSTKCFHEVSLSPIRFRGVSEHKLSVIIHESIIPVNTGEPIKVLEKNLSTGLETGSFVYRIVTKAVRCNPSPCNPPPQKRYILTLETL